MRRILLDENMPVGIREQLPGFFVVTVPEMGWAGLSNGELLDAADQAGFEVMVTGDQNIEHQNSLSDRHLALVVLSTTQWPTLRANPVPVREAVERAAPGSHAIVTLPRPKLRRRPAPARHRDR